VPAGFGALRRLQALQLEGCPLPAPWDALYKKDPLLLVALNNSACTALDISDVGGAGPGGEGAVGVAHGLVAACWPARGARRLQRPHSRLPARGPGIA
jgi:hypothetical protein